MIICPGGRYWDLYWELEGEEVAAWLNSVGMTGVILKYRCPRRPWRTAFTFTHALCYKKRWTLHCRRSCHGPVHRQARRHGI
jgi:hypothetical protein